MKKKLIIFLFIIFSFVLVSSRVYAKSCTYVNNDSAVEYSFDLVWGKENNSRYGELKNFKNVGNGYDSSGFEFKTNSYKNVDGEETCYKYVKIYDVSIGKSKVYFFDDWGEAKDHFLTKKQCKNTDKGLVCEDVKDTNFLSDTIYTNKVETTEPVEENKISSCLGLSEGLCENNKDFSCIWNESPYGGYCNTDKMQYIGCGGAFDIPSEIPELTSFAVNLLKIGTPIILIIVSVITLLKALASSKEDEIKKAQSSLVRRIIAAVIVFFVIYIVQFVILKVAEDSEQSNITTCASCFLNNKCDVDIYYKTYVGDTTICTKLDGSEMNCSDNT